MAGFVEGCVNFGLFEKIDIELLKTQLAEAEKLKEELEKKANPKERLDARKAYSLLKNVIIGDDNSFNPLDAYLKKNPIDAKTLLHICVISIDEYLSAQNAENAKNPRKNFDSKEVILAFRDNWIDANFKKGVRKENGWKKAYKREHKISYKKLNEIIGE